MVKPNPWWKIAAAVAAVLLLSAPAAVGVYRALAPTRGPWAAGAAALGFELAYLAVSLLTLRPELRRHARAVAIGAVATSISLNVLADYSARVAGGLASWPQAVERFDPLALGLAVLESAPLAGLAYALATLLHRLAEGGSAEQETHTPAPAAPPPPAWAGPVLVAQPATLARQERYPAPVEVRGPAVSGPDAANRPAEASGGAGAPELQAATRQTAPPAAVHRCKRCGLDGLTFADLGRHSRSCKGAPDA